MRKKLKIFLFHIFLIGIICIYLGIFLLYGSNSNFRDWLINTAMSTMNHKYLATFFYDELTINDCLLKNYISDFNSFNNLEDVQIIDYLEENIINYENEYEKQVLIKDSDNDDFKIIKIEGEKYEGYLAVIYDPSRVDVAVTKYMGKTGQYLERISEQNNALVAINGGGFVDLGGHGTGGEPLGITIDDGKLVHDTYYDKTVLKGRFSRFNF